VKLGSGIYKEQRGLQMKWFKIANLSEKQLERFKELSDREKKSDLSSDAERDELDDLETEISSEIELEALRIGEEVGERLIDLIEDDLHKIIPKNKDDAVIIAIKDEIMDKIREGKDLKQAIEETKDADFIWDAFKDSARNIIFGS
jgi:hypothetical protein